MSRDMWILLAAAAAIVGGIYFLNHRKTSNDISWGQAKDLGVKIGAVL